MKATDLKNVFGIVSHSEAFEILESCGREELFHTKLIEDIWKALKKKAILDISHYNALLKAYNDTEQDFVPWQLMEEMLNASLKPNR